MAFTRIPFKRAAMTESTCLRCGEVVAAASTEGFLDRVEEEHVCRGNIAMAEDTHP